MSRRWRLTPRAEEALVEIALWTIRRFGPGQADACEAELDRAVREALARGDLAGQDCSVLAGEGRGLRFIRAGRHFVVYTELDEEVVVLDVIHGRADLPRRLKALRPQR